MTATADKSEAPPTRDYSELLERVFDDRVTKWTAEAEQTERFPRKLIEYLGESGVFAAKWPAGQHQVGRREGHRARQKTRRARIGGHRCRCGTARFGNRDPAPLRQVGLLEGYRRAGHRGEAVLCIGASEQSGGSDLQIVGTEVRSVRDGFEVKGIKKFVSLSPIADHVIAVARNVDHDPNSKHGGVVVIAVPLAQCEIQTPYRKVGAGPLDTAAVHIDTWVPADALVARAGIGLAAISWGLAQERMSVAGLVSTFAQRVIGITLARMMTRRQFGHTLYDHQALRLRIADLQARVDMLRYALDGIAATGKLDLRTAAAMKVNAARLGEEVLNECMHIFGGSGYLVDETPLGRWWRDMKLARVGGGTDEVLWELVAAAMKPDYDGYAELNQQP